MAFFNELYLKYYETIIKLYIVVLPIIANCCMFYMIKFINYLYKDKKNIRYLLLIFAIIVIITCVVFKIRFYMNILNQLK